MRSWAIWSRGPRSGLTKKEGKRAARFSWPSRWVYSGSGRCSVKSAYLSGKASDKSPIGGHSRILRKWGAFSFVERSEISKKEVRQWIQDFSGMASWLTWGAVIVRMGFKGLPEGANWISRDNEICLTVDEDDLIVTTSCTGSIFSAQRFGCPEGGIEVTSATGNHNRLICGPVTLKR